LRPQEQYTYFIIFKNILHDSVIQSFSHSVIQKINKSLSLLTLRHIFLLFLLIFIQIFSNAQSQCGIRPDGTRAIQVGSKPGVNAGVRVGLDKICLMTGVSNLDFCCIFDRNRPI
jgi:hypothetical protein